MIEEKTAKNQFIYKGSIIKWKVANELNLIFTVVYKEVLHLSYVDDLLDLIKSEFSKKIYPTLDLDSGIFQMLPSHFDKNFKQIQAKWEAKTQDKKGPKKMKTFNESKKKKKATQLLDDDIEEDEKEEDNETKDESQMTKAELARKKLEERFSKKKPKKGPKTPKSSDTKPKGKEGRSWGYKDSITQDDLAAIDRSKTFNDDDEEEKIPHGASKYLDEDDGDMDDYWSSDEEDKEVENKGGLFSRFTNTLKTFTGNKELTEEDLDPIMEEFSNGLMEKNVAQDIAVSLCESIKKSLMKTKTESFTTVKTTVKNALIESLKKILTPKRKIDVLKDALAAKKRGEPYKIVFIGVNGVGKSTTLSKVGYFLQKKGGLNLLLAACDNFRAGAVEQLKVHARNLQVPIHDKGYKGDPAFIAQEAITKAKKAGHDVVLIDTAGRMQDNEPLMRALAKLVHVNKPDLVLFVGEALVGNDATDQLTKFNQALIDYSYQGSDPRTIDGIILSKCDTVDDKIGASISMVYSTGKPIVFMGIGEKYKNLKKMNINTVINALLS
eukprot:CAMPEP_0197004130 /NCGR_PEP_ID=MMETSP1380-20130617/18959_1 /TAXON_ID=5936 /ORGANISM="Euplotes crassus, Strain CT5" /LENGTH=551 /DNA_ID=CAMNT_0042422817 /DNA_START=104 /DNA_END=1759 /DNA_ORIENTATION=-